jgi:outer membrane lipoprotein-sorting protein
MYPTKLNVPKMKAFKKISIVLFVLLLQQPVWSQSFKERLELMQKEYNTLQNVHMKMSIRVFEKEQSTTAFYAIEADIKKQDQFYHYELGTTRMLMNANYTIMVDKASHEMACSKRSLKDEAKFATDPFRMNLDSVLSLYGSLDFAGKQVDEEHYVLTQKKGAIKQIDLYINVSTNVLSRIEYRYTDQHYVTIQFTLVDKQPGFTEQEFSENQYVIVEKDKLRTARAFAGYHLSIADSKK